MEQFIMWNAQEFKDFYLFFIYLLPHPFIKDIDYDFLLFFLSSSWHT